MRKDAAASGTAGQPVGEARAVTSNLPAEDKVTTKVGESQEKVSAFERVPKDANGKPMFSQAEPELAWDTILERTPSVESARVYVSKVIELRKNALENAEILR